MSTPIETNTEELQAVLQQVYNLPNRSGGSEGYDLIIDQNSVAADINTAASVDNFVITKGSLLDVWQKVQNGEKVKACVRCGYHYGLNTYRKVYDIDRIITEGLTAAEHNQNPSAPYHGSLAEQADSLTCVAAIEDFTITFQASTLESINNNVFDVVNGDLYPDYDFVLGFTTESGTSAWEKPPLSADMFTFIKGSPALVIKALKQKRAVKIGMASEYYYWERPYFCFTDTDHAVTRVVNSSDALELCFGLYSNLAIAVEYFANGEFYASHWIDN